MKETWELNLEKNERKNLKKLNVRRKKRKEEKRKIKLFLRRKNE